MAINPEEIDVTTVDKLDDLTLAIGNFFAHTNLNGKLGKATFNDLATFLASYIALVGVDRFISGQGGTDYASASYLARKKIITHAWYGFLDDSILEYAQDGFQGHASFNANLKVQGTRDSDHTHAFQDATSLSGTGTLTRHIGYYTKPTINAGLVETLYGFFAGSPTGTALNTKIENTYAYFAEGIPYGSVKNYAFYSQGAAPSRLGGNLTLFTGNILTEGAISVNVLTEGFAYKAGEFIGLFVAGNNLAARAGAVLGYNPITGAAIISNTAQTAKPNQGMEIWAYDNVGVFVKIATFQGSNKRTTLTGDLFSPGIVSCDKLYTTVYNEYADNAAAKAAGLTNGAHYRTGDFVKQVHS